jgi:hypothetical protein
VIVESANGRLARLDEEDAGSILKNGLAIANVTATLKPTHFYNPRHRAVFTAMSRRDLRLAGVCRSGGQLSVVSLD